MVTILHAADLHLDSPFAGLSPELAARRRGEQRLLLEDLADLARKETVELVLLSGDILDSEHVYRTTAQALVQTLGEIPCPVFLAPGNHDPYTPYSLYATLSWPENVHIFSDHVERIDLPEQNCAVYGYGFSSSALETSPLEGFRVEDPNVINLMCLHADLAPNSPYGPITEAQIAQSGLTYLALGHIHKGSGLRRTGESWWAYPGCPQGRGFDETGEKGVLLVRAEPGRVSADFVPLCRHRYEGLTIDLTGKDPAAALRAELPAPSPNLACRVELTGECEGLDLPALRARFEGGYAALRLKDRTRLPQNLWARRGEDNLTGALLQTLWQDLQADPDNERLRLAARFALAALEGGEDPAV